MSFICGHKHIISAVKWSLYASFGNPSYLVEQINKIRKKLVFVWLSLAYLLIGTFQL